MDAPALREAIASELEGNLLPFWRERGLDRARGGFVAEIANDGTVGEDAPRGLILNSRLLWTFAALYRHLGDERDLELGFDRRSEGLSAHEINLLRACRTSSS